MDTLLIVVIVVVVLLIAGGGVRAYGRNAEEITDRGDPVRLEPPGFKKPPGGDGGLL
jgi:hypothetical protein